MQIGIAAKISTTECCFTNATEMHTMKQNTVTNVLHLLDTIGSFNQVDAIPTENATCRDGQTLVLVSNAYNHPTMYVNKFSLSKAIGRRSCRFGSNLDDIKQSTEEKPRSIDTILHMELQSIHRTESHHPTSNEPKNTALSESDSLSENTG